MNYLQSELLKYIGISIVGALNAALIGGTSYGKHLWQYNFWALPVRLAKSVYPYLLFTKEKVLPPTEISSHLVHHTIFVGIIAAILFSIILLTANYLWFKNWEGRTSD
ncbi:hypothetical protein [Streptococcus catagoni]|uniref:hypothetical protein n=1 Tax=Streptococcus catagoni TaxID=2654874 RepID=UPI00140AB862|nr:hypothetical protein [Streptococcus catagoni]